MSEEIFDNIILPVYIINLKERTDRLTHVMEQFADKPEFEIHVTDAVKHSVGAVGLWHSMISCIKEGIKNDDDFIIVCEDDHTFTKDYDRKTLIQNIIEAHEQGCDILSGGIGGFNHAVPLTKNRYWINSFWCTQFIVVYRKFYNTILNEPFKETDTADDKLSEMTSHKMVVYPFISIQHDFGYSDVTPMNNAIDGMISRHFKNAEEQLNVYYNVYCRFISKESSDTENSPLMPDITKISF